MPEEKPISARRYLFCLEYVKDYNGVQAVIRAGYSENGASVRACKLLALDSIKSALRDIEYNRLQAIKNDGNKILADIARLSEKAEQSDDLGVAIRAKELLGRGVLWDKSNGGIKQITIDPNGTKITFGDEEIKDA